MGRLFRPVPRFLAFLSAGPFGKRFTPSDRALKHRRGVWVNDPLYVATRGYD